MTVVPAEGMASVAEVRCDLPSEGPKDHVGDIDGPVVATE